MGRLWQRYMRNPQCSAGALLLQTCIHVAGVGFKVLRGCQQYNSSLSLFWVIPAVLITLTSRRLVSPATAGYGSHPRHGRIHLERILCGPRVRCELHPLAGQRDRLQQGHLRRQIRPRRIPSKPRHCRHRREFSSGRISSSRH